MRIFAFRRESGRFSRKGLPGEPDVERKVVALEVVPRAKEHFAAGIAESAKDFEDGTSRAGAKRLRKVGRDDPRAHRLIDRLTGVVAKPAEEIDQGHRGLGADGFEKAFVFRRHPRGRESEDLVGLPAEAREVDAPDGFVFRKGQVLALFGRVEKVRLREDFARLQVVVGVEVRKGFDFVVEVRQVAGVDHLRAHVRRAAHVAQTHELGVGAARRVAAHAEGVDDFAFGGEDGTDGVAAPLNVLDEGAVDFFPEGRAHGGLPKKNPLIGR